MLTTRKEAELRYVEEVVARLFPVETPTPQSSESPDWILTIGDKCIGIEVTELPDDDLRPIEGNEGKLLNKASQIAADAGLCSMDIRVGFTHSRIVPNENILTVARMLVDFVAHNSSQGSDGAFDVPGDNNLCEDIDEVSWFRAAHSPRSTWKALGSNTPKDVLACQIQLRINDKQQKVSQYRRKCSECWLVIGADGYKGSTYFRENQHFGRARYQTDFDRVFFVNIVQRQFVELVKRKERPADA